MSMLYCDPTLRPPQIQTLCSSTQVHSKLTHLAPVSCLHPEHRLVPQPMT